MKGKIKRQVLFIFCLIAAALSTSWIVFSFLYDIDLILTKVTHQIILAITCLSLCISIIFTREILSEVKIQIEEDNEKQRSVRDFYQYAQLLDPPEMNN